MAGSPVDEVLRARAAARAAIARNHAAAVAASVAAALEAIRARTGQPPPPGLAGRLEALPDPALARAVARALALGPGDDPAGILDPDPGSGATSSPSAGP